MKDIILDQHKRLQKSEEYDISSMTDVLVVLMNAINPELRVISEDNYRIIPSSEDHMETISLFLTDKDDVTSREESNGFVEVSANRLVMQYFGEKEDSMSYVFCFTRTRKYRS